MKLARIVPMFILLLASGACGKAKEKTPAEKLVDEVVALKDAVCKCPKGDAGNACRETAMKPMDALETRVEKEFPDESKMPAALKKAGEDMETCAQGEGPVVTDGSGTGTASGTGTGTGTAAPATDQDKLLADMATLQAAVCACKDEACVKTEMAKGDDFGDRMEGLGWKSDADMPKDVLEKVGAMKTAVEDCAAKIGEGGGPTPPTPETADQAGVDKFMASVTAIKDEVCACKDGACATAAMGKGEALEDDAKALWGEMDNIPKDVMDKVGGLMQAAEDCAKQLAP